MSSSSVKSSDHHQHQQQLQQPSFYPTYTNDSYFQPTSTEEDSSPSLPPLSPTSADENPIPFDHKTARGGGGGLQKGQTLMTSYMAPVKSSTTLERKRTKSHASSSSHSSSHPQSLIETSPIDPFIVTNSHTSTNPTYAYSTHGVSKVGGGNNIIYQTGGYSDYAGGGGGNHTGYQQGGFINTTPQRQQGGGGNYQVQYMIPIGTVTPQQSHQIPQPHSGAGTGNLTSTTPLATPISIGNPSSTNAPPPLLTTSQLPLDPSYSYPAPSTTVGHYQTLAHSNGSPYPSYPTHFSTPQQSQYQLQPQPRGSVGNGDMAAYTMAYPTTHVSSASYGYHLPPPPPPSQSLSQSQSTQYYYPTHPQSAPAKVGTGYHGYPYPGGYVGGGAAGGGGHETPVRAKKGHGSARKGDKKGKASGGSNHHDQGKGKESDERRSSVETTPPPISRVPIVSIPVVEVGSSKKRESPVKREEEEREEGSGGQVKRARALEIKTSGMEGRRLAFPDTPSPETNPIDLVKEGGAGGQYQQYDPPRTPPHQIRSLLLFPRVVAAPGITETPNGTATVGMKSVLESDMGWLEPALKPMESPYYSLSAGGSGSRRSASVGNLTRSERRRRRVEAFRVAEEEGMKEPRMTVMKGYGRLAAKQTTALSFLGVDARVVQPREFISNTTFTPVMTSRTLGIPPPNGPITPKSTPQSSSTRTSDEFASITVPDWPDSSYPWVDLVDRKRRDADKMAEVAKLENFTRIERYLSHVSDDELSLEESDDSEEQVDFSHSAEKVAEPSDAKDAIFNVTRNGLPAFSSGSKGPYLSGAMPTVTGEDESGCLCGGLQQDAGSMVCCDHCSVWFHLSCCGIASEDDLGESWFCWRCDGSQSVVRGTPISEQMGTPSIQQASNAGYPTTEESSRTYHAYTSDAALAPSPVFSNSGRMPDREDTPGLSFSRTPRVPSSGSTFTRFMTPGTPSRYRNVSYAEHYNICQTPGAPQSDYKKVYSTPKFEDLLNDYTPMRATSPTPGGGRSRVLSRSNPLFTTPSTSQNFFQGLQSASSTSATPGLVHSSSASAHYSPYPTSPHGGAPPKLHPVLNDLTASPSPFRSHRRQVSFNRVAFATTSSHLRDSVVSDEMQNLGKGRPLGLGGDLVELGKKSEL